MRMGMIGLGRMGGNMVRRLLRAGHECVVFDRNPQAVGLLEADGAIGADSLADFVARLWPPRAAWMMIPAANVDDMLGGLAPLLEPGDCVVDGGNSRHVDDLRRAKELAARGIHYVDVGTSGGVWGLARGYCLMIGGEAEPVARLDPIFRALAPGRGTISATPDRRSGGTAEEGYLHCGSAGAGHFVKMVHNGIEYGLMAAYAEGFNILSRAGEGKRRRAANADTAPLSHPEHYQYAFDLAAIAELWRRGSVISSWLLDLAATALSRQPDLSSFVTQVSDSGEGRWTIQAAIEEGVPAPVLSCAVFQRFSSRGEGDFAARVLSALRHEFGGHGAAPPASQPAEPWVWPTSEGQKT